MAVYGAITYNRRAMSAAYSVWPENFGASQKERIERFVFGSKQKKTPVDLIDITSNEYAALSKRGRDKLARGYIDAILAFLKKPKHRYERITISGHGPFRWDKGGTNEIQSITAIADTPLAGMNIREKIADAMEMDIEDISVITDVAAIGIAEHWNSKREPTEALFPYNTVIAAIIVERGIGAAIVQNNREVVGQFHHAEAGHIRVKQHPKDSLDVTELPGDLPQKTPYCMYCADCLTSYASIRAVTERARQSGLSLEALIATPGHNIWEIEAYYLAQLCLAIVLLHAPSRTVLSGELIAKAPFLLDLVRAQLSEFLKAEQLAYRGTENMPVFLKQVAREQEMRNGALLHSLGRDLNVLS